MVHRVAVLDSDLCHSDKCGIECIRDCPVNINGEQCIVLGDEKLAVISESSASGAGSASRSAPSRRSPSSTWARSSSRTRSTSTG